MDPKNTGDESIQYLQDSINKLNNLIQQPSSDIPGINTQIQQLFDKQTDLSSMELKQDLDDASIRTPSTH